MDQIEGADTASVCRICRDEGTDEDPLFYPCKCSGSIRFIHKTCLDEWVKHSQNQRCGTCMEKFAYRVVYTADAPWFAPVATTLGEMLRRASVPIRTASRVVLVLALWFVVLPLVAYWTLLLLRDHAVQGALWVTRARFVVARSWAEWHASPSAGSPSDVVWHTGLCAIPDGWLRALYTYATALIKPLLMVAGRIPVLGLSNGQIDGMFDRVFETMVQATEGMALAAFGFGLRCIVPDLFKLVADKYAEYGAKDKQAAAVPANHDNAQGPQVGDVDGNVAEDIDPRNEELEPAVRMQALLEDVRRLDDRAQLVHENLRMIQEQLQEIENARQLGVMGMISHGIGARALHDYFTTIFGIQQAIVLALVVPYALGQVVINTSALSVIDYPAAAYGWLRAWLVDSYADTAVETAEWVAILHVLGHVGRMPSLVMNMVLAFITLVWIVACGFGPTAMQGVSSVAETLRGGAIGARMAAYLRETTASTAVVAPHGGLTAIHVGYAYTLLATWALTCHVPTLRHQHQLVRIGWIIHKSINIALTFVICVGLLPLVIGVSLHMSLAPALPGSPLDTIAAALRGDTFSHVSWYWAAGSAIVLLMSEMVTQWRLHTRPGFMWYVGRSDEPNNGLTHAGLTKSPLLVVWYWAKTVMALIVSGLAVPTAVLRFALATAPALFPIRLDEIGFYFTIANTVLVPAAVLVLVVERQRVRASAVDLFAKVSTAVAHAVRLTEYVTGKRAVSDEGRWVLKRAPWLDLWFVRPLMPSGVVDGCLEAMSDLQDKARAGDVDNAVPTSEYYAFLQKVIDDSLASTHPHLAFIVEPRNALVPNVHFLKKHDSRRVAIFVDDTGKPLDPLHDYETADDPGLRQAAIAQGRPVPAAAPHDEKSDLRFRREDYCVMYLPPWDDPREVAYLVLLQFAVGVAVLEVLISLWQIGKIVSGAVFGGLGSGLASISLGILVVSAGCAVARRRAWLLERIAHEGGAAAALSNALRAFRAASGIAWQVAVVLAVFAGAIPSLACYTAELYWGILYTGDVDVLPPAAGLLHALQGAVRRQLAKVLSGYIVYQVVVGRIGEVVFGGLGMLLRNPRRWPVRQWLARYAAPAICKLAALCVLPLGLALLDAALKGTASADMLWDLVRLRDAALLARHARVALLAMGALAVVFKAAALYVTCAQIVRDRLYAVGRELTNIDGTSTPGPQ